MISSITTARRNCFSPIRFISQEIAAGGNLSRKPSRLGMAIAFRKA